MLPSNHTTLSLSGHFPTLSGEDFIPLPSPKFNTLPSSSAHSLFCFLFHWQSRSNPKRTLVGFCCHTYPPACICLCVASLQLLCTCPYSYRRSCSHPTPFSLSSSGFLLQQFFSLSHIINFPPLLDPCYQHTNMLFVISSILIKILDSSLFYLSAVISLLFFPLLQNAS